MAYLFLSQGMSKCASIYVLAGIKLFCNGGGCIHLIMQSHFSYRSAADKDTGILSQSIMSAFQILIGDLSFELLTIKLLVKAQVK